MHSHVSWRMDQFECCSTSFRQTTINRTHTLTNHSLSRSAKFNPVLPSLRLQTRKGTDTLLTRPTLHNGECWRGLPYEASYRERNLVQETKKFPVKIGECFSFHLNSSSATDKSTHCKLVMYHRLHMSIIYTSTDFNNIKYVIRNPKISAFAMFIPFNSWNPLLQKGMKWTTFQFFLTYLSP